MSNHYITQHPIYYSLKSWYCVLGYSWVCHEREVTFVTSGGWCDIVILSSVCDIQLLCQSLVRLVLPELLTTPRPASEQAKAGELNLYSLSIIWCSKLGWQSLIFLLSKLSKLNTKINYEISIYLYALGQ